MALMYANSSSDSKLDESHDMMKPERGFTFFNIKKYFRGNSIIPFSNNDTKNDESKLDRLTMNKNLENEKLNANNDLSLKNGKEDANNDSFFSKMLNFEKKVAGMFSKESGGQNSSLGQNSKNIKDSGFSTGNKSNEDNNLLNEKGKKMDNLTESPKSSSKDLGDNNGSILSHNSEGNMSSKSEGSQNNSSSSSSSLSNAESSKNGEGGGEAN